MNLNEISESGTDYCPNFVPLTSNIENCWICEGWVECEFEIDALQLIQRNLGIELSMTDDLHDNYLVFMHFDFDDYQPDRMDDLRKINIDYKGRFRNYRMVPQGRYHYFFSYNNKFFHDDESFKVKIRQEHRNHIQK